MESGTTLLAMIESINVRNDPGVDERFTTDWFNNGLLMASLVITIVVFTIILSMYMLHLLVWEPRYLDLKNWNED